MAIFIKSFKSLSPLSTLTSLKTKIKNSFIILLIVINFKILQDKTWWALVFAFVCIAGGDAVIYINVKNVYFLGKH